MSAGNGCAILVIGPNGVGKTKFAYRLAREVGGEIINLDRTYLYRGFPITTGLADALKETGVRRHFYEQLEAHEPSYAVGDFVEMVCAKIREITDSGGIAIAEGASTAYVPALLKLQAVSGFFAKVIGLRFANDFDVRQAYRRRIDEAFREGLAEELAASLSLYRDSFLIKECHFAVPTVKYLDGEIGLQEAKDEILARCMGYKDRQLELFAGDAGIEWIDSSNMSDRLSFEARDRQDQ